MIINTDINIGDIVYLVTDNDQLERMITAICVRPKDLTFELSCGTSSTWHNGIELTKRKDIIKATSN